MKTLSLKGRWVLVTGASSGLGREIALSVARDHGAHPILVARRADRLEELRRQIEAIPGIQARVIQADLSKQDDVDRVFRESTEGVRVDAVVLNAGVTYFGHHRELGWPQYESIVATNVTSVVRLTDLFVPYLLAQGQGGAVMLVTSMAGIVPTPYQAVYSGTKAFVTHFGQSVAHELHGENVSVTVFAPGGIVTEMNHLSGLAAQFEGSMFLQAADHCAREAVAAMVTRKKLVVPGWFNRLQLFMTRLVPRDTALAIARQTYRQALAARDRAPKALAGDRPQS